MSQHLKDPSSRREVGTLPSQKGDPSYVIRKSTTVALLAHPCAPTILLDTDYHLPKSFAWFARERIHKEVILIVTFGNVWQLEKNK